jgi:hypothetical protein
MTCIACFQAPCCNQGACECLDIFAMEECPVQNGAGGAPGVGGMGGTGGI